jgi:hypothetical protein
MTFGMTACTSEHAEPRSDSEALPSFIEPVSMSFQTEVTELSPEQVERLNKLENDYKAGLFTKDEYDRKRQEILAMR